MHLCKILNLINKYNKKHLIKNRFNWKIHLIKTIIIKDKIMVNHNQLGNMKITVINNYNLMY